MKHILVPTDFSPAADNALAYAEQLAVAFQAKLSLVHAYMVPVEPEMAGALDRIVLDNAESLMQERVEHLGESGVPVATEIRAGTAVGGIRQYLSENDVDLIVMGCQGEQAIPARFIGSTTTALLDVVEVPVLAVPVNFWPRLPRQFVWATDQQPPRQPETLQPLLELLEKNQGVLHIFHHEKANARTPAHAGFAPLLGSNEYDFWHQASDEEPLEEAINDFIESMEADLLVMLHRRQGWFARLFRVSVSRREVWSAPIPVLVLRHEE